MLWGMVFLCSLSVVFSGSLYNHGKWKWAPPSLLWSSKTLCKGYDPRRLSLTSVLLQCCSLTLSYWGGKNPNNKEYRWTFCHLTIPHTKLSLKCCKQASWAPHVVSEVVVRERKRCPSCTYLRIGWVTLKNTSLHWLYMKTRFFRCFSSSCSAELRYQEQAHTRDLSSLTSLYH